MTPQEVEALKTGDQLVVISDEPILYFDVSQIKSFNKGDILTVGDPPTIPSSPGAILIKLPQVPFHAVIHRTHVELYKKPSVIKECTCNVWVTGCKCGVFQAEMDAKRGHHQ